MNLSENPNTFEYLPLSLPLCFYTLQNYSTYVIVCVLCSERHLHTSDHTFGDSSEQTCLVQRPAFSIALLLCCYDLLTLGIKPTICRLQAQFFNHQATAAHNKCLFMLCNNFSK